MATVRQGDPNLANMETLASGYLNKAMTMQAETLGNKFADAIAPSMELKGKTEGGTTKYDFPFYGQAAELDWMSETGYGDLLTHTITGDMKEPRNLKLRIKQWQYEDSQLLKDRLQSLATIVQRDKLKMIINWIINGDSTSSDDNLRNLSFVGDAFFKASHETWGKSGVMQNLYALTVATNGDPTVTELAEGLYESIALFDNMKDDAGRPLFVDIPWGASNIWVLAHTSKRLQWSKLMKAENFFITGGLQTNIFKDMFNIYFDSRVTGIDANNDSFFVFFTGATQKSMIFPTLRKAEVVADYDRIEKDVKVAAGHWARPAFCDFRTAIQVTAS